MSNFKLVPILGDSWRVAAPPESDTIKQQSESKLWNLIRNVPLWIRTDRSDLKIARSESDDLTEWLTGRATWMIPCDNMTSFETSLESPQHDPMGIGQLTYNAMPSFDSLSAFAGFEIECSDYVLQAPQNPEQALAPLCVKWPPDVETPAQMASKIVALKRLSDAPKPIGISIPLSSLDAGFFDSLRWLLDCPFDWINWRFPSACLGETHAALDCLINDPKKVLNAIQAWQSSSGKPLSAYPAIVLEHAWESGYQAAQMIREGASVVVLPHGSRLVLNAIQAIEAKPSARNANDSSYPSGSFGATLGFNTASYLQSKPAPPQAPDEDDSQYKTVDLEDFISQMISYLALNS